MFLKRVTNTFFLKKLSLKKKLSKSYRGMFYLCFCFSLDVKSEVTLVFEEAEACTLETIRKYLNAAL